MNTSISSTPINLRIENMVSSLYFQCIAQDIGCMKLLEKLMNKRPK